MKKHLESPLACLLLLAILFLALISGRLYRSQFNPSSFIVAGDRYCDPSRVPSNLSVLHNSDGFDGQFYYRLALNPFTSQRTEFGITLDTPALRHQRILYPLLSLLISLGNREFVPTAMILLNFLSLCLMGWIGGIYARALNRQALWGILLPLYPGFLLSLTRDTTEILEATLLLGSLLLVRRRSFFWATLLLALAVLTRETAVLVAAAALVVYLRNVWKTQTIEEVTWYYAVVPIAAFVAWQFILFHVWGELPLMASSGSNLGIPFVALISSILAAAKLQQVRKLTELTFLIGFVLAVLYCLRSSTAALLETFSWLLLAALVFSLSHVAWIEDWTFMRAFSLVYGLGVIIIVSGDCKIKYAVFTCSLILWMVLFSMLLRFYSW